MFFGKFKGSNSISLEIEEKFVEIDESIIFNKFVYYFINIVFIIGGNYVFDFSEEDYKNYISINVIRNE